MLNPIAFAQSLAIQRAIRLGVALQSARGLMA
jgi:hypothetical protein